MARLKDELSKLKASASGDTEEKKPTPISRKAGETKISAADASTITLLRSINGNYL